MATAPEAQAADSAARASNSLQGRLCVTRVCVRARGREGTERGGRQGVFCRRSAWQRVVAWETGGRATVSGPCCVFKGLLPATFDAAVLRMAMLSGCLAPEQPLPYCYGRAPPCLENGAGPFCCAWLCHRACSPPP